MMFLTDVVVEVTATVTHHDPCVPECPVCYPATPTATPTQEDKS